MKDPCSKTLQHLFDQLEPADLAHLRECAHCRETLDGAASLDQLLHSPSESGELEDAGLFARTGQRLSDAVRRIERMKTVRYLVAASAGLLALTWLLLSAFLLGKSPIVKGSRGDFLLGALPVLFVAGVVFGYLFGLALGRLRSRSGASSGRSLIVTGIVFTLLLFASYKACRLSLSAAVDLFPLPFAFSMILSVGAGLLRGGKNFPPKRLSSQFHVSGVSLGLSEATSIPVGWIRLGFVALIFLELSGIVLYLVFDMLMDIHSEDRAGLLRFRLERWLRRGGATRAIAGER